MLKCFFLEPHNFQAPIVQYGSSYFVPLSLLFMNLAVDLYNQSRLCTVEIGNMGCCLKNFFPTSFLFLIAAQRIVSPLVCLLRNSRATVFATIISFGDLLRLTTVLGDYMHELTPCCD